MSKPILISLLSLCSISVVYLFLYATSYVTEHLSPQGCRMSYMSPGYIPQTGFDVSWTPLAQRYSLFLYREAGWEPNQVYGGAPVLFIPGNAGSYKQVRSIASSAARQYFSRPNDASFEFTSRGVKPLDVFTVEFNEDLSAFHGPTLESQITYTSRAIDYILSMYAPNTSIIIMGHSMGGVVATSLLPSNKISSIITMSTPHTLPPARFDQRIDKLYAYGQQMLLHDSTPIVSICGGATDMMIPSESCILPRTGNPDAPDAPFRSTVFSSALEGAWTGVGHQEMVWCHQVRWRVARVALELSLAHNAVGRSMILDRWLRDGHTLPPLYHYDDAIPIHEDYEVLPAGMPLVLKHPKGPASYLLPVSPTSHQLTLFVSQGSISPVSPQRPNSLKVSVQLCGKTSTSTSFQCETLHPSTQRLIPNPVPGRMFPTPREGSDESEGVVLFEADVPTAATEQWVAVVLESARDEGWVVGGFSDENPLVIDVSTSEMLFRSPVVEFNYSNALKTVVRFPNLLSNALVVYRATPQYSDLTCRDALLLPLLMHTPHSSETHYHPLSLSRDRRILLHTHGAAPYVASTLESSKGVEFVVYSSGSPGCLTGIQLSIDWIATIGRWPTRYFTTVASWAVGVVSIILFQVLGATEDDVNALLPSPQQSLRTFCRKTLPKILLASYVLALIPFSSEYFLGTNGSPVLAPLAPLFVLLATGLVCTSWFVLMILMWPIGKMGSIFIGREREEIFSARRSTLVSICLIFVLVFFIIPWQVAYLSCWIIHLYNTASAREGIVEPTEPVPAEPVAIPLLARDEDRNENELNQQEGSRRSSRRSIKIHYRSSNISHSIHLLLLMTWLLPLAAPVLVVWVRTLATAGLTTPFDGDHFFLNVAPFLILVDFASWTSGSLFQKRDFEKYISAKWVFVIVAGVAFFVGPRKTYHVFDAARIAIAVLVVVRIGPRYWGATSWTKRR
ncbi:GPI-inositol-deacylase [Dendrothele bispora CBS 962.96]|uniref:GPI inositol-deacylase n=1 Tax=Dendrothele bispora (strain CBS 962.96) TaxID=1314807 RepID=A0A4S8MXS5_DENBC|nr:GPI-inositol-deacylase [Dendrothele bispora CBS 962.96]